jgi:6-phosphofructokinase 1
MEYEAVNADDLRIDRVGPCLIAPPGDLGWVADDDGILLDDSLAAVRSSLRTGTTPPAVELAGPRDALCFDPTTATMAIVTCGGLCPGINDVIRAIVMQARHTYGVARILGIRYGFEGLDPSFGHTPVDLTPEVVKDIPSFGGSFLGTSRGKREPAVMVDRLLDLGVDMLFVIGGDGSQRGAAALHHEVKSRGARLAVVGVPKTIDNDILFMDRCFGYETAFAAAFHAVKAAHSEAIGARHGLGLVKLMGRDSGFIACSAALATGEANFVLIPEVPFRLDGANGLLALVEARLRHRGHAVIIAAEGAGQELIHGQARTRDASGNTLNADVGAFLKEQLTAHFQSRKLELNLKYIDPSYIIRSVPAAADDRIFCLHLGRHAVHAAMAGKTGMVVARWHDRFVHLPMSLVNRGRRKVDPHGDLWRSVLESTGQPAHIGN